MSHFAFIFAAYSAAALGIIGLSIAIVWRGRVLTKKIATLEALDTKRQKASRAANLQSDPS